MPVSDSNNAATAAVKAAVEAPVAPEEKDESEEIAPIKKFDKDSRKLSAFSSRFDFDGNGELDEVEANVRDLYRKSGENGPKVQDVYNIAKDQYYAEREARLFKKMTCMFASMAVLLVAATFGLVFVAVHMTKETQVNNQGQLVGTTSSNMPVSTLGSGSMGHVAVADEDSLFGEYVLVMNGQHELYVASISKSEIQSIWQERQTGIPSITTDVYYSTDPNTDHNWLINGNIDRHVFSDRIVYTNFETTYFPDHVFSVVCYDNSDLCAITQKELGDEIGVSRRRMLDKIGDNTGNAPTPSPGSGQQKENGPASAPTPAPGPDSDDGKGDDRRNLSRSVRVDVSMSVWDEMVDVQCWLSNYELHLVFANSHMQLLAFPMLQDCPILSVDVGYAQGLTNPTKMVTFMNVEAVQDKYGDLKSFSFDQDYKNGIPLAEIIHGVNDARVARSANSSYDPFANNCSTFILDVLDHLGIKLNDDAIAYVSDSLYESGFFTLSLDAQSEASILDRISRRVLGDRTIVKLTVQNYLQTHEKESKAEQSLDDL